ncbi:hypothetical protein LSCM1_06820 [Leishmania martiniquensis]|uniref:Uncharacterized protein n=1 Tax=Leishmania martiniquensis TaxID=1580590 RepID=A0A836HES5_9TRYP|nr:hypothetical protein LSCM1_06820 [Leishmania martiniquensis]
MRALGAAAVGRKEKMAKEEEAASATTAASSSPLALLQYGASLYEAYTRVPEETAARMPPSRYADYLHHFGFSMERESRAVHAPRTVVAACDCTKPAYKKETPLDGIQCRTAEAGTPCEPVEDAGWGLPEALRCEADLRCNTVGPMHDATEWSAIAEQLAVPFTTVTWRQTSAQCAIMKARCVYVWLCSNMALQVGVPGVCEEAKEESRRGLTGGQQTSQQARSLERKPTRAARKAKEAAIALEPSVPLDPVAVALQTRRAPAPVLADVYMRMLASVGVSSEVVVGQLKGAAPEESFEWSWNIVSVEGTRYLVDVSAALSNGVLRSAPPSVDVPSPGASAEADKGQRERNAGIRGKAAAPTSPLPAGAGPAPSLEPLLLLPSTSEKLRRDFFFFAHPTAFLASHLPTIPAKSLTRTTMKAMQWAVRPHLTPAFHHYGLQLCSHMTHGAFLASESPSYVSLVNPSSSRTELCCVLYAGTLRSLPEDLSQTTPLGAEWVWHQREESTDTDTFTLTVPQAGYYVLVVGARPIRADPYSAVITVAGETAFTPVVSYDIRVDFTPSSCPVLPRQYFSPSICRLMTPLCSQVAPGRHAFRVMPSCSNVLAVAIVQLVAATAARKLLAFLPFELCSAAFEGTVDLCSGGGVEVWMLYGAPDRNGQELGRRVAPAASLEAAASATRAPASSAAKTKAAEKKRKWEDSAEQQRLIAAEAQLAHLTHAVQRGEVFQRYVGGIEVRNFISSAVMGVIRPQPSVEQERRITLRRLAGVTGALLSEAEETMRHQPTPVGGYFVSLTAAAAKPCSSA